MPYIEKSYRTDIRILVDKLEAVIRTEGDLNYAVSMLLLRWLKSTGKNYKQLNKLIGVLECVKQEFYRRVISEYENEKMDSNGDVFP